MARRRNTSRVTQPGTGRSRPGTDPDQVPQGLPSIRQRKPVLYWTLVVAVVAMVIPLVAGIIQGIA